MLLFLFLNWLCMCEEWRQKRENELWITFGLGWNLQAERVYFVGRIHFLLCETAFGCNELCETTGL